jgi:hypothetical protein
MHFIPNYEDVYRYNMSNTVLSVNKNEWLFFILQKELVMAEYNVNLYYDYFIFPKTLLAVKYFLENYK